MAEIPMKQRRHTSEGFTLLELLIALFCAALISVALADALNLTLRGWKGVDFRQTRTKSLQTAEQSLKRLVEQAEPPRESKQLGLADHFSFTGQPSSVRFVAAAPPAIFSSDYIEYTIELDREKEKRALIVSWKAGGAQDPLHGQSKLMTGVESLKIAYFGRSNVSEIASWTNNWSDQATLPSLVHFALDVGDPLDTHSFDIFASPRLAETMSCFDERQSANCSIDGGRK